MLNINSLQNKKIKYLVSLRNNQKRKKNEYFLIDGLREITEAYNNKYIIKELFVCQELIKEDLKLNLRPTNLSKQVFLKVAYPQNPDGYLALAKRKECKVSDFKGDLVVVLEKTEKPGNLGAIIRTVKALGIKMIILNDLQLDIYNPNTIKASTGFVFSVPIINLSKEETVDFLKREKFIILATNLEAKKNIFKYNLKQKIALVFGSEANGLSDFWKENSDELIKIPMLNQIDSLNLSVSVAVSLYESKRQRKELTA